MTGVEDSYQRSADRERVHKQGAEILGVDMWVHVAQRRKKTKGLTLSIINSTLLPGGAYGTIANTLIRVRLRVIWAPIINSNLRLGRPSRSRYCSSLALSGRHLVERSKGVRYGPGYHGQDEALTIEHKSIPRSCTFH